MHKKTWLIGLAAVMSPLVSVGLALLVLGYSTPARAGSPTTLMVAEDTETSLSEISALSASVVQTWTHTTRADWEQGTLEWLDSATVSGSLGLMQRLFGESTTITPREDLGSGQTSPDIAVDTGGNAYAVWEDGRNGHTDIYFAYRAAVSTTWGASVKVNDDTGMAQQGAPAIAVDTSGNAYVVWADERNGDMDIYFAYRPAGGAWETNIRVDDDIGTAEQVSPDIAVDPSGNAYAAWVDGRSGDDDIYFAYHPAGGNWGANVRVNDDASAVAQRDPAVAVDTSGNAYLVWADERDGDEDIYFAHRPVGGDWGANVRVNDDPGTAGKWWGPAIAVDPSGNACAVWLDERDGDRAIYFAYRPAGGVWQANVRVDDGVSGAASQYMPSIAVDSIGNAYAVWRDSRAGNVNIYFANRPAGGNWGTNVRVNDDTGMAIQESPAIAVDPSGNAYAVWKDSRNGNPDIYSAVRPAGGMWEANVRVDDDTSGTASQINSAIAVDASGNTYAVWEDTRNGDEDIYFAYRPAGGNWSANVKVNDDTGVARQWIPDIAVDSSGNAYAVWMDERNGDGDIYFVYRPAGGSWGTNVKVNDDTGTAWQGSPDIAVDVGGNAYAVWTDGRSGNDDIYFSYRPVGGLWGANVQVSDAPGTVQQFFPVIAVDASGNAYTVWEYDPNGSRDIYFAYRAAISMTWSADVKVHDDPDTAYQGSPAVAVDASGNAYAVWYDGRNSDSDIYFSYRPVGGNWGTNVRVNNDSHTAWQYNPVVAVDASGNAYAVWTDSRNGNYDIYFAYRPAGGSWGTNVQVNDSVGTADQRLPDIALDGAGNAYVVWLDYGYGTGHIYFAQSLTTPEYAMEGHYTSPELDTGVTAAIWESFTWQGSTPTGTSLAFETRSRIAGGTWSAWEPADGAIASPAGQYFQYRVTFSTTLTDTTPLLEQVQIVYRSFITPSAPRFSTPCGVTNQRHPTLRGSATGDTVVRVYADGSFAISTTVGGDGVFAAQPSMGALGTLQLGTYVFTATAENESGPGPASAPLTLTVDPALPYDPINVRAGQWSKDGWLMSVPRDADGCADPTNDWRIWPRWNQRLRVEVPVSYTVSAAVTVTVGTVTITLTEESVGLFAGVFQPPIHSGDFIIEVNADGATTIVDGGPVLIDPDGVVYEAGGTISDTIPGVQITCYYLDTHSGQWLTWDAWTYDQVNPQVTLDDGYYSFYTPPGTYRVTAEKEGYPLYTSPDLAVVDRPVRHNIPLGYRIYLPLVLKN
jgi:hypothetical protein